MSRLIPLILAVALFMESMDASVVATALPAIAADIGTTPVALKLAFTAYFVAMAIFIPISAWMADRFGAKRVFRGAILVFILGSLACAFADTLGEFVAARFFKGIGGAMTTPIARLILFRATPRKELVGAVAWLSIPALVAPMTGPPVGGFLTTYFSWHWVFIINVPIGLAGFFLVGRFLPDIPSQPAGRMDWIGFFLLALGFSGTLFGFSLLSMPLLPLPAAIAFTLVGAASIAVYVLYALKAPAPLLDPRLFRHRTFRAAIIGTTFFFFAAGALPFLLPLMLQLGFGMTPFEAGLLIFSAGVGAFIAKFFLQRLYRALGFRTTLMAAGLLTALSTLLHAFFGEGTPILVMLLVIFLSGMFRSAYLTGQNALVLSDIAEKDAGAASALSTVTRPIATALAVAMAGGIVELSARMRPGPEAFALIDFQLGFVAVALLSALAALPFFGLPRDAGASVSGHVPGERNAGRVDEN